MYKVFINENLLILTNTEVVSRELGGVLPEWKREPNVLVAQYQGKVKFLHNYIDMLEKSQKPQTIVLHYPDLGKLWHDFISIYKLIEAAGGVVTNSDSKILVIYRRGSWDLPKGKIDKGETPEQAAVREIQEETGLQKVILGPHLHDTFHTYPLKGKRILKKTYWYDVTTSETQVTPQYEEDIEKAEWVNLKAFLDTKPTIYGSILEVLSKKEI